MWLWCAGESFSACAPVQLLSRRTPSRLSRCLSPAETPERPLALSRIPALGQGHFLAQISTVTPSDLLVGPNSTAPAAPPHSTFQALGSSQPATGAVIFIITITAATASFSHHHHHHHDFWRISIPNPNYLSCSTTQKIITAHNASSKPRTPLFSSSVPIQIQPNLPQSNPPTP